MFQAVIFGPQNRARAKSELAVLSQSIEQFKQRKGDYPWTSGSDVAEETLLEALLGWKEFERTGGTTTFQDITDVPSGGPKSYIDTAQFYVSSVETLKKVCLMTTAPNPPVWFLSIHGENPMFMSIKIRRLGKTLVSCSTQRALMACIHL